MTDTPSDSFGPDALLVPALAFAIGTLAAGYATLTAWTNAYLNANPETGTVSGGSGSFTLGLFVVGAVVAFLAVFVALHRTVDASE
ncbi:hypothetical protein [Halobacterium rubrum]|uniref:hypothetical protein n=1 Tax=Halobacterium TaxID=2239 RepID=UPI001F3F28B2|nr:MULTISPECIES: hypothetical protein [Halobacterium]MDH5020756.1 hypothetical protein [Halobacterium rubrum]